MEGLKNRFCEFIVTENVTINKQSTIFQLTYSEARTELTPH